MKNVQGHPRLQEKSYEDRLSLDMVPDLKNRVLLTKGKLKGRLQKKKNGIFCDKLQISADT